MIDLERLAKLAYLDPNSNASPKLLEGLNATIHFVEQLQQIEVENVKPLIHPIEAKQYLRVDTAIKEDVSETLEKIAPQFDNHFYLVPRVL